MLKRSTFNRPQRERTRTVHQPIPEHLRRAVSYASPAAEAPQAQPKPPEPVRSEEYRRLVAALPCANCGRQGHSQHAHENEGKAKGRKLDDRRAMPLCADDYGLLGCHSRFDRYALFPQREDHISHGKAWAEQTRRTIEASGLWPKTLPKYTEGAL